MPAYVQRPSGLRLEDRKVSKHSQGSGSRHAIAHLVHLYDDLFLGHYRLVAMVPDPLPLTSRCSSFTRMALVAWD
jgi:hypothetical protein